MPDERPCVGLPRVNANQVEWLLPAAVRGPGFEAKFLHALRQVDSRHRVARAARTAALVAIVADLDNDAAHVVVGNLPGRHVGCGITAGRI